MILIITSVILTILAVLVLGVRIDLVAETISWKASPRMLFGLLFLLINVFGCFTTIKTGEVGIKVRFGEIVSSTTDTGIVFKLPFEDIKKINVKVQKYENEEVFSTSTKDLQIVNNIKVSINYQIDGTKAVDLYKTVGTNYQTTVLEPAIQETIKAVISQYTAEELVTKRSDVSIAINNTLDERISLYGINSVAVSINNFDFSESYNQAIEQKAVAEQEVETSKNQLEKAKIDAEKKKVEAQGEAEANALLQQSLTDQIIAQQFIEKWNGQLPTTMTDSAIPFINAN